MSDITLIRPGADVYQHLKNGLMAIEPPSWTRMIAGWLRDNGFEVAILDQEAENLSNKQIAERTQKSRWVAVIVEGHQPSSSTQQMTAVTSLLESLHDRNTILVGNHVSALPERTLIEEPVDCVCDGEGPLTLAGLLNNDSLDQIPGLVWRDGDTIRRNPLASLIPIDELHGNVWDLLPMGKYRAHTWQCLDGSPRQPYASIYTTQGCPFKCSFCMINVFQHSSTYRRRTPEKVVEQVRLLYNAYGVTTFKIADEMFVLDPTHYLPIFEGLAALPFANELNIWAYARIDTIKPEPLDLLRRASIRWLALGIESGSSYVRDGAKKHLKDNDIVDIVQAIQKAGISIIGNFIFGLKHDTMESMQETLTLAKSLNLDFANFYSCMPYPGSKLFDETKPEDLPDNWSGYSQHSFDTTPLPTAILSSADVLRFRDRAFIEFNTDSAYLERIKNKFGFSAANQIKNMTAYNLPRKLVA